MNIQEIREGIWQILHSHEKYEEWSTVVSDIFSYLAEKGACFPVEGELPILEHPHYFKEGITSDIDLTTFAKAIELDVKTNILKAGCKKVITPKEMMGASK